MILIQDLIHEIRGKKVMLDFDLARLYQVETKALKHIETQYKVTICDLKRILNR